MTEKKLLDKIVVNGLSIGEIRDLYIFLDEYETTIKNWKFKKSQKNSIEKRCQLSVEDKKVLNAIMPHSDMNKITFYNPGNTVEDILRHIRNSVAHAKITKVNGQYHFEDYTNTGKLSMYANIDCNLFDNFIKTLKAAKK